MHVKTRALRMHLTSSSCIVVRRHTHRASSSSHVIIVYLLCAIYVDIALCRTLLRVVVVVRCHCQVTKQTIVF